MLAGGGRWKEGWEPSGALFGVNNSYLITCKGGRHLAFSKNLSEQYPGLHKRVRERFERVRAGDRVVCMFGKAILFLSVFTGSFFYVFH